MRAGPVVLLVAVLGAACGEEPTPDPAGPRFAELEADQIMVEVDHYMTREGVRRAHLRADTVYFLDQGATAHLRRFTVDFFGPTGAVTSVLSARDGVYRLASSDMEATEDVLVVDEEESQRLRTERLVYDAESGELRSDVEFVMVQGRDTIRGVGFVTDPGLDSLTIRRPGAVLPPADAGGREEEPDGAGRDGPAAPRDPPRPTDPGGTDTADAGAPGAGFPGTDPSG